MPELDPDPDEMNADPQPWSTVQIGSPGYQEEGLRLTE
jgi:hypothetical protein